MADLWRTALVTVVERIDRPCQLAGVEWALAGSAATALQGCSLTPRDIDILLRAPGGVDRLSRLMERYAPLATNEKVGTEGWVSSRTMPIADENDPDGFHWHWARWLVKGVKVEAAHIRAPNGAQGHEPGIWENGPEIWSLHRLTRLGPHSIRVPPLEVQLATCARRGLATRVEAIIEVLLRDGVDGDLLRRCLAEPDVLGLLNRLSEAPRIRRGRELRPK